MPARLRPTAPFASNAILVGDPGRALLLAQELLGKPKMSNHARGLWGYTGTTPAGEELTIQATGIGGPSAAIVLADLVELGVRRVVRVGTCVGFDPKIGVGEPLLVGAALASPGSATSFGVDPGATVPPDPELQRALRVALGDEAREVTVVSLDTMPTAPKSSSEAAADMQTLAVLALGRELGIAAAAVLIAAETARGDRLEDEELGDAAKGVGLAASRALSNPRVEG